MANSEQPRALRARWVFPVDQAPIRDGVVTFGQGRLIAVGSRPESDVHVVDLGEVALLPGLVNAHTHLEFSDCPAPLAPSAASFAEWIGVVTRHRLERMERDPSAAGRAIQQGLQEAASSGTTTLGEIATAGWALRPPSAAAIDVVAFREVIALSSERFGEMHAAIEQHLACAAHEPWSAGISPHAPYTVHPELFCALVDKAAERALPVAMHLAESPDELDLLRDETGPLVEYLAARGFWVAGAIPRGTTPMNYLRKLADAPRALIVHGNYLSDDEIQFVAANRAQMSVVYCPRTHHFFGHQRHPLERLLAAGSTVALGTDSRASNPDLNLLAEMRLVAQRFPSIAPADVLKLGTLAGAQALGLQREVGSLTPGKWANLAVLPIEAREPADPHELIFAADASVSATLARGSWLPCGRNLT